MRRASAAALLVVSTLLGAASMYWRPPAPGALATPDAAAARLEAEVTRQFGMELPIVWVVEARSGTIWSTDVLSRVQALTRAVFALPGVIAPDVVSIASPNVRDVSVTEGGIAPRYLMGDVPRDAHGVAALRARVEQDPMLRGNLVSLDGRAALVAANFRSDADRAALARAALAVRDRFRDDVIAVFAVGAPTLALTVPASVWARLPLATVVLLAAGLLGCVLCSARRVLSAVSAGVAVGTVTAAAAAWLGATVPWAALAAVGAAGIAMVLGLHADWRAPEATVLALAAAAPLALTAAAVTPPVRWLLAALALGVPFAPLAVTWTRTAVAVPANPPPRRWRWPSHVIALAVAGAALGALGLDVRFDAFGYGRRYLPSPAREDVAAMARHFAPPASFVVRVRGTPGFVTQPGVLEAFDQVTQAVRRDPAVASALSLADLVKRVHRTFNDDRPEFERLPEEAGMVGRYLALAYSPGFRRFVDRPLATAAIWVTVASPAPGDVARVHAQLVGALEAHPVPHAAVDPPAGDAMDAIRASRIATALARGGMVALPLAAIAWLPWLGAVSAGHALAVAVLSAAAAAGCVGWLGGTLDLVTLPGLLAVSLAGLLSAGTTATTRRGAVVAARRKAA